MKTYKEMNLVQGTEMWHEFRREHITATDSAKLLGKNPWATALDCYNEKVEGKKTFVTEAMQRGIDLEPVARDLLISIHGINLQPKVFESVEYTFMGASLDAISNDNRTLYEIKCVGEKTFKKALKGEIDPIYMIQCNKQMLVMGLESMYLFFYFNDFLTHTIKMNRKETLIKEIIESDSLFWLEHLLPLVPPQKYGDEFERIESEDANILAAKGYEWATKEKEAKAHKEDIYKQLEQHTKKKNCLFPSAGIKHSTFEKKGLVDWKLLCADNSITDDKIELYRKEATTYSKFSEM